MLNFDPARVPAVPKDAATVVVVREQSARVELFCVERHARSGFLGGAVVFPGGKVDPADHEPAWSELSTALSPRARSFASESRAALGFAVAALRELLEEAAILPVAGDALDDAGALRLRGRLESAPGTFAELLRQHGLVADTARLEPLWRWVTPEAEARRYDTRFYLLPAPTGQLGAHDQHETTSSFWATPAALLERWERGEILLIPPTVRTIQLLARAHSVDEALTIAQAQSLEPICPAFMLDGEQAILTLPGDPLHPTPHPAPSDPEAPTRFVMDQGRFVGKRA